MLVLVVITTIAGSLLVEWMINHLSEHYEVEWWTPAPLRRLRHGIARLGLHGLLPVRRPKPIRVQKAERQMNGAFKEASDEIWLK